MSKSLAEPGKYICDFCGKEHYRRPGNIYKLSYKHHVKHFCSYSCYYKAESMIKGEQYEEINKIFDKFSD